MIGSGFPCNADRHGVEEAEPETKQTSQLTGFHLAKTALQVR